MKKHFVLLGLIWGFTIVAATKPHASEFVPKGSCEDEADVEKFGLNCGLLSVIDEKTGEPIPVSVGEYADFMGTSVDRMRCVNGWPASVTADTLIPNDIWFSDSGRRRCD